MVDCICQLLYGIVASSLADYRLPILIRFRALWTIPHRVKTVYEALRASGDKVYKPTGLSFLNEKNFETMPIWKRAVHVGWDCGLLGHFIIFTACLLGLKRMAQFLFVAATTSTLQQAWIKTMTHVGWPPLLLLFSSILTSAWIPVAACIWPVKTVERRTLLQKTDNLMARYPSTEALLNDLQPVSERQVFWLVLWIFVVIIWTLFLP
jgi:hypothetical protein